MNPIAGSLFFSQLHSVPIDPSREGDRGRRSKYKKFFFFFFFLHLLDWFTRKSCNSALESRSSHGHHQQIGPLPPRRLYMVSMADAKICLEHALIYRVCSVSNRCRSSSHLFYTWGKKKKTQVIPPGWVANSDPLRTLKTPRHLFLLEEVDTSIRCSCMLIGLPGIVSPVSPSGWENDVECTLRAKVAFHLP